MPDNSWTPAAIATIVLAATTLMLAIATGLTPLLRLIKSRKSQPASIPSQKTATQKIKRFLVRVFTSPWPLLPFLLVNIYLLVLQFRDTAPVTRRSVLITAFVVAEFVFAVMSVFIVLILGLINRIVDSLASLSSIDKDMLDIIRGLNVNIGRVSDMATNLHTMIKAPQSQPAPDKVPQGMIEKLQAAINKLLGD